MTYREKLSAMSNSDLADWLGEQIGEQAGTDWTMFPNFSKAEFVCTCGKCEYSTPEGVANLNPHLLTALQFLRNYYGKPVKITCGARCVEYNNSLSNSVKNTSKHTTLDAADFYIQGVTSTEAGRDEVVKILKAFPKFNYAYHNKNGSTPQMGSAVHGDYKR